MALWQVCERRVFEGFNFILGMAGANFMACILSWYAGLYKKFGLFCTKDHWATNGQKIVDYSSC